MTEIHSNKSNSSIRKKSCTPLYLLRQGYEYRQVKSRDKLTTQENFKKTISGLYDHTKKPKSKKRTNSKKRSTHKKEKTYKRPGSALGHTKSKNLRSNSKKSKHLRKNESLYLDKYKSKESTLRYDESLLNNTKKKVSRNNSKSYIKINGFENIIRGIRDTDRERNKNFSKIEYTMQNEQLRSSKRLNLLTNQYIMLNRSKAPSVGER